MNKKRIKQRGVDEEKSHHIASKTKKHRITQVTLKEREQELLEWKFFNGTQKIQK